MERVEYISFLHKQNLNGRETEDELFEAGILAGIEETEILLIVVYLVIRVDTGENEFTTIEKTFKNKKDADNYKDELSLKYKESLSFQNKFFYFYHI